MSKSAFHIAPVDLLHALATGCDPNEHTASHVSLLHYHSNNPQAVATLLEFGADPTVKNLLAGYTPLHSTECAEVVHLLVQAGADIEARDAQWRTALHLAVSETPNLTKVRSLLHEGANPSAADYNGITPLHLAQTVQAASMLIDAGADMHAQDRHGNRPSEVHDRPYEVAIHILMRIAARDAELQRQMLASNTAQASKRSQVGGLRL